MYEDDFFVIPASSHDDEQRKEEKEEDSAIVVVMKIGPGQTSDLWVRVIFIIKFILFVVLSSSTPSCLVVIYR